MVTQVTGPTGGRDELESRPGAVLAAAQRRPGRNPRALSPEECLALLEQAASAASGSCPPRGS